MKPALNFWLHKDQLFEKDHEFSFQNLNKLLDNKQYFPSFEKESLIYLFLKFFQIELN